MAICFLCGCGQRSGSSRTSDDKTAGQDSSKAVPGEAKEVAVFSPAEEQEKLRQYSLDGDISKVEEALEAGADVNSPDAEGHTALMFAAFNGHSEIVLTLLDHSAGVDRRDLMGRTALLYAATGPFPETVKILLDKGAKPNVVDSDEHFSPLMHAAAEGNLNVVKILIGAGADPTLKDVDGDDALSFAQQAGHQAVVDFLQPAR